MIKIIDGKQLLFIDGEVLPQQTLSVISQNVEQSRRGTCTARIEFLCGTKDYKLNDFCICDRDAIISPKGKTYRLPDPIITPYEIEFNIVCVRIDIECKMQ